MIKQQDKFIFSPTKKLIQRVKLLCTVYPTKEWSGILFFSIKEGQLDDMSKLIIEGIDVYPLNLGNATFTSYTLGGKESLEIAQYMRENEYDTNHNVFRGHIHSHNTMNTNFSGTDIKELEESAQVKGNLMSLIVNNAGSFNVCFSSKVFIKENISIPYIGKAEEFHNIKESNDIWYWEGISKLITEVETDKKYVRIVEDLKNTYNPTPIHQTHLPFSISKPNYNSNLLCNPTKDKVIVNTISPDEEIVVDFVINLIGLTYFESIKSSSITQAYKNLPLLDDDTYTGLICNHFELLLDYKTNNYKSDEIYDFIDKVYHVINTHLTDEMRYKTILLEIIKEWMLVEEPNEVEKENIDLYKWT